MVEARPATVKKTFEPGIFLMKSLENELSSAVDVTRQLLSENAVSPLDQYFTCPICLLVVEQPAECQECNQLCCEFCISVWKQRNNSCPKCRCELSLGKQVNRFVMQSLNTSEFTCEKCHERFTYDHRGLDARLTGVEPARVVHEILA